MSDFQGCGLPTWRRAAGGCPLGFIASRSTWNWPAGSRRLSARRIPRDTFRENCWITTECDEHLAYHVVEELGDDRILFETDFPHPDSKYPKAVQTFLDQPRLSDESKRKILWDNAVDFYRFPETHMPTSYEEAPTNYEEPAG